MSKAETLWAKRQGYVFRGSFDQRIRITSEGCVMDIDVPRTQRSKLLDKTLFFVGEVKRQQVKVAKIFYGEESKDFFYAHAITGSLFYSDTGRCVSSHNLYLV